MKKIVLLLFLSVSELTSFAGNEVQPEGGKLIWFILIPVVIAALFFLLRNKRSGSGKPKKTLFSIKMVKIELKKDRIYFPDKLTLSIKNIGNTDIDLDRPLLIFDNFWLNRKFRLKGVGNYSFYPLYLERGKTHTLQIDMPHFYRHDKKLKKFPKVKIKVFDVNGKHLGSKSVYLRKTLFRF